MDKPIGKVVHYYDKLGVAIINLEKAGLKIGDKVKFKRAEEEFTQLVESLQINHQNVEAVKKRDSFGLKVEQPTKPGTQVYLEGSK